MELVTVSNEKQQLRFNPKWIFIILGAVVLVEVLIGIRILSSREVSQSSAPALPVSSKGIIALKTSRQEVSVGDIIPVTVEVTSPSSSVGVDIVAKFDPKSLEVTDSAIQKGTIYPQFPLAKIEGGEIRISGISPPGGRGFSGEGIVATISFKALKAGTTTIVLDFSPGSTADSNMVSEVSSKDLLEEVQNLEVTIR